MNRTWLATYGLVALLLANPALADDDPCKGNLLASEPDTWLPKDAKQGKRLTRAVIAGSRGYNPITENGADVSEIWTYVGGGVATRHQKDPDTWGPDLAECVTLEETGEGVVFTVKLRKGILWHPIQPEYGARWAETDHEVTVDDFIFALDMIRDLAVEGTAPTRVYIQDLERIEKVDSHTMTFHWKRKVFFAKSVTLGWAPVPKWLYANDPDGKPYPPDVLGQNFNQHWYPLVPVPSKCLKS